MLTKREETLRSYISKGILFANIINPPEHQFTVDEVINVFTNMLDGFKKLNDEIENEKHDNISLTE